MSDPTLSDIVFKNYMALVWTTLKIQKLQLTDLSKLCIFRRWRLDNELRIRFCSEWWRILNDFARFSQHEIFCHLPILDIFFRPEGRSSRTFNQISREMIALKSNICLRSDQSSPKSVQSDQMESLADGLGKIPSSDPWSREWILLKFFFSMQRAKL